MPERFGPFYPDVTAKDAPGNGTVVGIAAGDGCADVESMSVWISGSVVEVPARFFRGDALSILFNARDGRLLPDCCEAFLLLELAPSHPA